MKIATWNVNGIRAREAQLLEWLAKEQPDVVCLQEIKAQITQLPLALGSLAAYDTFFHGSGGYSGVSLHVKKSARAAFVRVEGSGAVAEIVQASAPTGGAPPLASSPAPTPAPTVVFSHPHFDMETRIVEGRIGNYSFASVYVPNGGKDYPAKIKFFEAMIGWARTLVREGRDLVLCGDLNITHRAIDVHPTQRNEKLTGQRPEERALFDALLDVGLVDVTRRLRPDDDALFSWWPYWRQAREKNVGWRLDYVLTTARLAERVTSCEVQREFGSSDHGPLIVEFDVPA